MGKKIGLFMIISILLGFFSCEIESSSGGINISHDVVSNEEARPLPTEFTQGMAISYSGYRTGQNPGGEVPTEAQILEDLLRLEEMGFSVLRLYDAGLHAERVLKVIHENNLSLKIMQGVWISGDVDTADSANKLECNQAIEWANDVNYKSIILAISVGNECMVDWNSFGWQTSPSNIAYYVSYVRNRVEQPVTVDDNWEAWSLENEEGMEFYADVPMVYEAVDFVSIHTYPIFDTVFDMWDYKQLDVNVAERPAAMMDAALVYAMENFSDVQTAMEGLGNTKPVIIGETGWRSFGGSEGLGHPVNQKMYYDRLEDYVYTQGLGPEAVVYFEAFDEPWKGGDDGWGLFNVDRQAKYVVYSEDSWNSTDIWTEDEDDTDLTIDNAICFIPPPTPLAVDAAANDNTFLVFADNTSSGYNGQLWDQDGNSVPETVNLLWEGWEAGATASVNLENAAANGEDAESGATETVAVITPAPMSWGWGMMALMNPLGYDLTDFSQGYLNFRIKTTYGEPILFGIQTGLALDNDGMDWLLEVDPADNAYGYSNDGSWHDVTIPIADLDAAKTEGYNQAGGSGLDKVYVPFVVADYSNAHTEEIWIDNIRWTTN